MVNRNCTLINVGIEQMTLFFCKLHVNMCNGYVVVLFNVCFKFIN